VSSSLRTKFERQSQLEYPPLAFFAVILADVWQWTPFIVLITLAGLQAVPRELTEAARVDGASPPINFPSRELTTDNFTHASQAVRQC
jgi:ABC-type sugar transport system permease subunit